MIENFRFGRPGKEGSVIIEGGRVLDPSADLDLEGAAVWIEDGRVRAVLPAGEPRPAHVSLHDARGCWVMPGFIDLHVHLRDPGFEAAEDLQSGTRAAVAGGFATVCAMPNTLPPPDNPEQVAHMRARIRAEAHCRAEVVACATVGRRGQKPVDVAACVGAGAVAFSDDGDAVADAAVLMETLFRCAAAGAVLSDHCERAELSRKAPMAAGAVQEKLGCAGQPWPAETVQLAQGILLSAHTGARYHAQHLSSRHSVALVRWSKECGFPVTAEVTVHHLALAHDAVAEAGPMAKCAPPLREPADRRALLEGVREGVIDAIVTDHAPHEVSRKRDLETAAFGVIGLETAWPVLHELVRRGELPLETALSAITHRAARCFGFSDRARFVPGAVGDVTVYDPAAAWSVTGDFVSKSRNSPFAGWNLPGRVRAVFVGGVKVFDAASAG